MEESPEILKKELETFGDIDNYLNIFILIRDSSLKQKKIIPPIEYKNQIL